MNHTMMDVCKETNLSYQTLKFYCNEGLIPNVRRDENNRRVFADQDVAWIKSLICLRKCGMGIQEMKEYLALCQKGKETIPERKLILKKKETELKAQVAELEESLAFIAWKQSYYDEILEGKKPYISNVTPKKN